MGRHIRLQKEFMNLEESGKRYMGEFGGRKEKGDMVIKSPGGRLALILLILKRGHHVPSAKTKLQNSFRLDQMPCL